MLSFSPARRKKKGRIGCLLARRAFSEEKYMVSSDSRSHPTQEKPIASAKEHPRQLATIEIGYLFARRTSSQQESMLSLHSRSTNEFSSHIVSAEVEHIPVISGRSPLMGLIRASSMQLPFDIDDLSDPIFGPDVGISRNATIAEAAQVMASSSLGNPYKLNRQMFAGKNKGLIASMEQSLAQADDSFVLVDAARPERRRKVIAEPDIPHRTNPKRLNYQQSYSAGLSVHASVESEEVQQKPPERVHGREGSMLDDHNVNICSDAASAVLLDTWQGSTNVSPSHEMVVAIVPIIAASANRCVPRMYPTFTNPLEDAESITIPDLDRLVNYPEHLVKQGVHTQCTPDGKRHCTMCGKLRFYSKTIVRGADTILRRYRGICTACVSTGWVVSESKLEIKWCIGHAKFLPWTAFDKPFLAHCFRCRIHNNRIGRARKRALHGAPTVESSDDEECYPELNQERVISASSSSSVYTTLGEEGMKVSPSEPISLIPPSDEMAAAIVPTMAPSANRCVARMYPTFTNPLDDIESITIPDLNQLVNYPDHLLKKRARGVPSTTHGKRYCAMCGKLRETQNSRRGFCTACVATGWEVMESKLEIKWCSGHRQFLPWAAFGDKPLMISCSACRRKGRGRDALRRKRATAKGTENDPIALV